MGREVQRFVNKTFFFTVDWELLRRFLQRYAGQIGIDLRSLGEGSTDDRSRVFEYFLGANEKYPAAMMEDLHRISALSCELGVVLLRQHAQAAGVRLVPPGEASRNGGLHLSPRYLALRTFLDHPAVFDAASDGLAFRDSRSPAEFAGEAEGVAPLQTEEARASFEQQAAEFFNARYKGNYCRVRWYPEDEGISLIVVHGKEPVTTIAIEDDEERPLTFREMREDTLAYDQQAGRVKVTANGDEEKQRLCDIFAATMLGRPDFFRRPGSRNLYTLARIAREGEAFHLDGHWDPALCEARVIEIQVDDGARGGWSVTVRDPQDAVTKLFSLCPHLDLGRARVNYVKLRFAFAGEKRTRRKTVKLKPPNLASFDRSSLEARVLEHLKRNGFCVPRLQHVSVA
ncbi:MAG: hypothetical protein ACE149_14290 [Armatimonadota bacterium]